MLALAAILVAGGGVQLTSAAGPPGASVFVPIEPCRVLDTRPEFQVGPRVTPIAAEEAYPVSGRGAVGECTLPDEASGLALNVTAVDATAATFLTIYPTGTDRPNASNLNPTPGEPPTPNAVTVGLGAGGQFTVYNRFGTVHAIADVIGYYTGHDHDDRYYTRSEIDDLLAGIAASTGLVDTYTRSEIDAALAAKADADDVYTKSEVDDLLLQPTSGEIVIPMADFEAGANQTFNGYWIADPTDTGYQCLFATPELPAGVGIDAVRLVYSSEEPRSVDVGVTLLARQSGLVSLRTLLANEAAPLPATGDLAELGTRAIGHDTGDESPSAPFAATVPTGNFATLVSVCISDPEWIVFGVRLTVS